MPTYEYECEACGHLFSVLQKMTDDPLETCPVCGGKVQRLVSGGAGFIFKGSGFYTTDYRSENYKKRAKEESSSSASTDSKSESKSETKKESSKESSSASSEE